MTFKKCRRCESLHSLIEFSIDKSKSDGRSIYCSTCRRSIAREKRATEKHKINRRATAHRSKSYNRNWQLKARYGITADQFDEMLAAQGFKCLVCETQKEDRVGFVVDHSHTTGKIRGILCNLCNVAIGSLKENTETAEKLIKYLRREYV